MSTQGRRALEAELGHRLPAGLGALTEREARDLADAIHAARRRQAHALDQAGERALARIPRLLRGPIRKVVG